MTKPIVEANREVAYHNRLNRAVSVVLSAMAEDGLSVSAEDLTLIDELKPPMYSDMEIQTMALDGLKVVTTGYSQHVFKLAADQEDRL